MKFLFDDASFSFEALRAAGFANYSGADIGEVVATAQAIPDGDEASWHREWKATAERVEELGRKSLADGHRVSAREALLRASNYYRTGPGGDPAVSAQSRRVRHRDVALRIRLRAGVRSVRANHPSGLPLPRRRLRAASANDRLQQRI